MITRFLNDETGATAIEYALLAAILAVAIIAGLTTVGTTLNGKFQSVSTTVAST